MISGITASLAGVVSNQLDNDPEDIRIEEEGQRIFVKRRNDSEELRIYTITYRVNAHGADYFVNKKVAIRKASSESNLPFNVKA